MENTPKAKAEKLIKQFLPYVDWNDLQDDCTNREWALRNAKNCALILCDEILSLGYSRPFYDETKEEIVVALSCCQ